MRIKHIFFLTAILLSGINSSASVKGSVLRDTLPGSQKPVKTVKVGPVEYWLPPPVDSVLLRRLAKLANDKIFNASVDAAFIRKEKDDSTLRDRQNILLLQQILTETETSDEPNEKIISTLSQVLDSYKKSGDIKGQSLIMNTYAVYYVKKGEVDKAIPYFQDALHLKELTKDKKEINKITINLAGIYKVMGKYNEAIALNESTIRNSPEFKERNQKAEAYINIASMKGLTQKYDEAENDIIRKALPLFSSVGNKHGRMLCFTTLGELYTIQKRYSEAKWYLLQADALTDFLNDKQSKVANLIKLAEVKNAIGDHDLALEDYKLAEQLASENNYKDKLAEIKGEIGETYWKMGNYTAANNALNEYTSLKVNIPGVIQ
jgi:tetratricopeptide (TPR) repeat protein